MSGSVELSKFRELHEKHKRGVLTMVERREYASLREELTQAFAHVQRVTLRSGQTARQSIRVAYAAKVEVAAGTLRENTLTLDLSIAGFGAFTARPMTVGALCDFALRLVRDGEPVRGRAQVVSSARYGSGGVSYRVSFAIVGMTDNDRARLENAVLDVALDAARG